VRQKSVTLLHVGTSEPSYARRTFRGRIHCVVEGNLHFANVRMEDARNGSRYLCVVMNSELRSLAQGDDQKIEPIRRNGSLYSLSLLLYKIVCLHASGDKCIVLKHAVKHLLLRLPDKIM